MYKIIGIVLACVALSGCTDASYGKLVALGNSATITCYSGGVETYSGKSTGKIQSEAQSDGYYFRDQSGAIMEVSGDCVITYD